jgi:colanic acid biosynthesis protein WcaH
MVTGPLPAAEYLQLIAHAPLVSIDLIVRDIQNRVLVGLRRNAPAQGYWFVPGGAIRKGETLDHAFARISHTELGQSFARRDADLLGIYEHLYADNFLGTPGIGTHYVVLAHTLHIATPLQLPQDQHSDYRWMTPLELREHPKVHHYTRTYFS